MEAIVLLGSLIGLAIASAQWGADSRPGLRSKEHELALYGVSWQELAAAWDVEAVFSELQAILHGRGA